MNILLTGVSCVGKTTIGKHLADRISCKFFDLDREIEKFYKRPIERLKIELFTEYEFREKAASVLHKILMNKINHPCVVALPPSGLMDWYWKVIKRTQCITIAIQDIPKNILSRLTFYDIDSNPLQIRLTKRQKTRYLKSIREDMSYFNKFYNNRADGSVNISGLSIEESALKIKNLLSIF